MNEDIQGEMYPPTPQKFRVFQTYLCLHISIETRLLQGQGYSSNIQKYDWAKQKNVECEFVCSLVPKIGCWRYGTLLMLGGHEQTV
jgi:hypothetical protein